MDFKNLQTCKKCGSSNILVIAEVTISMPVNNFHNLTKKAISSRGVRLWGVDWEKASFVCGNCFYTKRLEKNVENVSNVKLKEEEEKNGA